MAIRSIKRNIDDAKKSVRTGKALDKVDTSKMTPKELEAYEMGMANRGRKFFDSIGANKKGPRKRKPRTRMMGGGKVYTSMDKKYGGGIFPRKGNM